jgi:dihydroneopterin aldolase
MWIRLKNIQVYAYHGVHAYEQEHGARFEIDVELNATLDKAAKTDELSDTIDYVEVQKIVTEVTTGKHFNLIESLADRLATELLDTFPVQEVIVRVRKPGAAMGAILDTVEIECRKRKEEG